MRKRERVRSTTCCCFDSCWCCSNARQLSSVVSSRQRVLLIYSRSGLCRLTSIRSTLARLICSIARLFWRRARDNTLVRMQSLPVGAVKRCTHCTIWTLARAHRYTRLERMDGSAGRLPPLGVPGARGSRVSWDKNRWLCHSVVAERLGRGEVRQAGRQADTSC